MTLTGGPRLSAREEGKEEEAGRAEELGRGGAGPRAGGGEEGKKPAGCWTAQWRGKRPAILGRAGRERRKGRVRPGCKGKNREGKRKRESGPGPIRKRGRKGIAFKCI
jgi:hypothetical protein